MKSGLCPKPPPPPLWIKSIQFFFNFPNSIFVEICHMTPSLGFGIFEVGFCSFLFLKYICNILKNICRVYFIHFGYIILGSLFSCFVDFLNFENKFFNLF